MDDLIESLLQYSRVGPHGSRPAAGQSQRSRPRRPRSPPLPHRTARRYNAGCTTPDSHLRSHPHPRSILQPHLNALKYNDRDGKDESRSVSSDRVPACVLRRDNGIGIEPEYLRGNLRHFPPLHGRERIWRRYGSRSDHCPQDGRTPRRPHVGGIHARRGLHVLLHASASIPSAHNWSCKHDRSTRPILVVEDSDEDFEVTTSASGWPAFRILWSAADRPRSARLYLPARTLPPGP